MTELLTQAFLRMRALPPERQDDVARLLLRLVGEEGAVHSLTPAEEASFDRSLTEADLGMFASDDEVRAIWARYGL